MRRPLLEQPTLTANGAVVGRPRKQPPARIEPPQPVQNPPPDVAKQVEEMAAALKTKVGIAAAFGTNPRVLNRWFAECHDLGDAFAQGRDRKELELKTVLFETATGKRQMTQQQLIAAIFCGKAFFGWREGEAPETGNRTNVVINLPGPRPLSDFVEVTPNADGSERARDNRLSAARS